MFTPVYWVFPPHFNPEINHFGGFVIAKKIDASFLSICALIDDKLHHNIVKVCGRNYSPAARDFLSHFDNVMTQFIINKSTEAWKNWRPFINPIIDVGYSP